MARVKGTAEAAKKVFPVTIFVRHENPDNDEGYFLVDADITNAEDGEAVAIYTLQSVSRKQVEHSLI